MDNADTRTTAKCIVFESQSLRTGAIVHRADAMLLRIYRNRTTAACAWK